VPQPDRQLTLEEHFARINRVILMSDVEVSEQLMTKEEKEIRDLIGATGTKESIKAMLRCSHDVLLEASILSISATGCGVGRNDSLTLEAKVSELDPDGIYIVDDSIVIPCFKKWRNCVSASFLRSVDNATGPGRKKKPRQYLSRLPIELQIKSDGKTDEILKRRIFEEVKDSFCRVITISQTQH
jgi:hypothetical protein